MVLGTTSGAGKSWLTTALCRYYARQGLKVAPYKAQNMSNNARLVAPTLVAPRTALPPKGPDFSLGGPAKNAGGEIGSAQYFQALAARTAPDIRMNPLLLKPEKNTQSQVVLMGRVYPELLRMGWRGRSALVWPVLAQALDELLAENEVVVIEGAGSPAEINHKSSDIVNMRVAQHANAACLLVTDIDRGGAFAHLYGTWAMLDEAERKLIKGFVLNKIRGDASLLAPGPQMLQDMTGIPTVATLPMWWQHGLPEENGVFHSTGLLPLPPGESRGEGSPPRAPVTIAVIAYPRSSNLDEFQPLQNVPGVHLIWIRTSAGLAGLAQSDWIILPGSKATSADLDWLRTQGLDQAIAAHAGRGGAVLGICGGLQMLGEALIDPHGIDGNGPGLGLLPVVTVFDPAKTVQHKRAAFGPVRGLWSAFSGVQVQGYEIHHGQTALHSAMAAAGEVAHAVMPDNLAWQNAAGNVLGLYLHGMFEDPRVLQALFGAATPTLDSVFDGLADFIARHFEPGVLQSLLAAR